MDNELLDTPVPTRRIELTGFWIRAVAIVIDTIVLF